MMSPENEARRSAKNDLGARVLEHLVSRVGGQARVQAVFGDPVERNGVTVIPVARVRWGVGGGGGAAPDGSGSGGGGGAAADPIGYIEITSAGASFRPIAQTFSAATAIGVAIAAAILLRAVARLRR
jgi:uncharacterized spore protein YtfJ